MRSTLLRRWAWSLPIALALAAPPLVSGWVENGTAGAVREPALQCAGPRPERPPVTLSSYDRLTLSLHPVLYLGIHPGRARTERDLSGCGADGRYLGAGGRASALLPDHEPAAVFNGSQALRVRSNRTLSIAARGSLTVQAWIRPSTLDFKKVEGTGYVELLGKGGPGAYEYVMRIYSRGNSEGRANRISGYAFNPVGGKGSGGYFQDRIAADRWIMVTAEFDLHKSARYPTGSVAIYKNGELRQRVPLAQFGVVPRPGPAPFTVATLTGDSYFQGSVAKVAVFDRALSTADIRAQYSAMQDR